VTRSTTPDWLKWLRAVSKGGTPAGPLPSLAVLTGQDTRALNAIAGCWQLLAYCDEDGQEAALAAVRMLLPALQRSAWPFARELIAWALDWSDRDRIWQDVLDED